MTYLIGGLIAATLFIAVLCYSWMKSTRASQARVEGYHQRTIDLLEEQTRLLERLINEKKEKDGSALQPR